MNRFELASNFLNVLWLGPLLTLIVGWQMWIEVGAAGLVGILVIFAIVPVLSEFFHEKMNIFIQNYNLKKKKPHRLCWKINIQIPFANG